MNSCKIELIIDPVDFKNTFGREPKDVNEFEEFCYYCEKGLKNGHIDWDIILQCAKEAVETSG